MKKKFSFILILMFILNANFSFAEELLEHNEMTACSNFYKAVKEDELPYLKGIWPSKKYDDYGFYVKRVWDVKKKKWVSEKDNNENLKVGEIYSMKAFNSLKTEDSIVKINDKKVNNIDDFNEIYNEDVKKIKIELQDNNGENYLVFIERHTNKYNYKNYSLIDFNISELDLKKGYYEVSIHQSFQYEYDTIDNIDDSLHEYVRLGQKYLIGKLTAEDEEDFSHICDPTEKQMRDFEINNPLDVTFLNILRDDNDLQKINYMITPYKSPPAEYDALRIEAKTKNVQRIKNEFNLKSFPFDKQVLKYTIVNNNYSMINQLLFSNQFTYETLNNFIDKNDIPGWHKNSFSIKKFFHRNTTDPNNFRKDGLLIEIELERKHGYYIFKVIFPIVLILIVCWSVVWINPKEIEARLTITIVCLLSLIAYNFVIDEELPKLEYLTVMDWIVLTSYVYATIPNFLSIYSFANRLNLSITERVDNLSKKFGLSSYLAIILIIVFLNANLNPENSSALIGWMAFR